MKTLRMGFIGCGPRARGLMKTTRSMAGLEVTAVCDKFSALAEEGAKVFDHPPAVYTGHERMLREAPVDAVFVVVEPENSAALVVASLEAGKHVLSEVPMAFTMEDCWRIVRAVEKTGLKYQLGEQMRFRPHIEKWTTMEREGVLGKIVYAEGEYLHGMGDDRYYLDPVTGERLTLQEAEKHPKPMKSRLWAMRHPILYLPHELSPLLRVMDDRVVSVTCMGTKPPSYRHDFFPNPDFETALMRTAKDTVLRLSASFTLPNIRRRQMGYHWHRVIGTKGCVETHRSDADKMKWLHDLESGYPEETWWDYDPEKIAPEILASGHDGSDYYPLRKFVDAVLDDKASEMDVYCAAESAAPAILAAESAEANSRMMEVPDFRPSSRQNKTPI